MRKELIWVAIIGISFGLIIAFGVWRINSSLYRSRDAFPVTTPNLPNPGSEFKITLNSPGNNSVATTSPILITGISKALTWIVVSGETGDYILQSDEKGEFNQNVDLKAGINQIKVFALDQYGKQNLQKVLIVYSSAFEPKNVPSPAPGKVATGDAAIREKVSQKVADVLNQPKVYLGVVTDITNTTIQIKDVESQIEQISVGNDSTTTVINTKGTNNKQVKLADIAIGDFIVAMGYVENNRVLSAQRILIDDPVTDRQVSVSLGKIASKTKTSLTATELVKGEGKVLTPDKSVNISAYASGKVSSIKLASVNANDLVIYVMDTSGTPALLRSIFDLGQPQN